MMYMYKCRSVVLALVSHPQWPKAMRHTFEYEGKETTPFRYMIRTMPGKGVRVAVRDTRVSSKKIGVEVGVALSCTIPPPITR
jgi:hypothetical protein